jgi:hypothetical protein
MGAKTYEHFLVTTPSPYVAHVEINRPNKMNAFIEAMWLELRTIMDALSIDPEVRAVIISGTGDRAFTTGLDVQAANLQRAESDDVSRKAVALRRHIQEFQDCISSVEKCEKRMSFQRPPPPHRSNRAPLPQPGPRGKRYVLTRTSYSCHCRHARLFSRPSHRPFQLR